MQANASDARLRRWLWGLLLGYSLVVFSCLDLRPLWLDEVIQLIVTTSSHADDFMRRMGTNPGAVPLGYLTQRPFVLAGGHSAFWARFPAAVFSILSCGLLMAICRELKLNRVAAMSAALFIAMPLQFCYATEARPYSEALCFCLLATLGFLKLSSNPSARTACLCILATIAVLYTQPYAILSVFGVSFWVVIQNAKSANWKRAALPPVCLFVSLLAFLPWYLSKTGEWAQAIRDQEYPPFHWTMALALDVIKSLSGDGFLCSIALILLVAMALSKATQPAVKGLLLSVILFTVGGAVLGDAFKNYFFASRQILFAVPALAILAALGFSAIYTRSKVAAFAALAILLGAALQKDVTMQMDAKENWQSAANAVAEVARTGRCLKVVPANSLELYDFFAPGLMAKACSSAPPAANAALVTHLYTLTAGRAAAEQQLRDLGFAPTKSISAGGTTITLEERR